MDYKDTLLMPQTGFDMQANLITKEKTFRKQWRDKQIYDQVLAKNKAHKSFILHDGPPYANGDLHVGHALNKILKDIVVRRKNMEGFYSPYLVGWDTHGLPIESKMLGDMQVAREDLKQITLRKEAAKYALQQVEKQKAQFEKMQLFAPLDNKYLTLDKSFEVGQLKLFKKMVLDGLVYKGLKPIYWSPSSQSALAEAEVEYKDCLTPQIMVAFVISKGNQWLKKGDHLLIMTTTPWTLIANAGVAVNVKVDYGIVVANKQTYVIALKLVNDVAFKAQWEHFKILNTIKGQDLLGLEYICPLQAKLKGLVVASHHVTTESGTGLVHMAPLFGEDDYIIGQAENLNMIMHVDDRGYLNDEAGAYAGQFYEAANRNIGKKLEAQGKLLSLKFVHHSYPHDWRTGLPIIYRGVPQWFVNIQKLKADILTQLSFVKSFPAWGTTRLASMIESRNEWTISRQRAWGVPIIIFYDRNHNPILKEELFDHVINLVATKGTDIWWEKTTNELLPPAYRNQGISREMDIMDVWFDSGASSISVQVNNIAAPFDLYLEGLDQYRGWFNSSLINSVAYRKKAPFKTLVSHGFVLNGNQEKMSKSKGNVIDPLHIIATHGADVLRLWVANSEYTSDITISDEIIKQTIELYRKMRNTMRFMLGNLHDFHYVHDQVKLDGWHHHMENKVKTYENNIMAYYATYNFKDVVKETNKLLIELSGWYFNYAKDILYCNKKDDIERRKIQTNMFNILLIVLKALAPIMPTTIEEAYQNIPNYKHKESIFLEEARTKNHKVIFTSEWCDFEKELRPLVNNLIEAKIKSGQVKRSNELILYVKQNMKMLASNEKLAKYLLVAKVKLAQVYKVETFESIKCPRCWNYFHENEMIKNICNRCYQVLGL